MACHECFRESDKIISEEEKSYTEQIGGKEEGKDYPAFQSPGISQGTIPQVLYSPSKSPRYSLYNVGILTIEQCSYVI